MKPVPMPGSFLAPQATFPTTEDAQASYGFARPEAPAPLATGGEGGLLSAERLADIAPRVRGNKSASGVNEWLDARALLTHSEALTSELKSTEEFAEKQTALAAEWVEKALQQAQRAETAESHITALTTQLQDTEAARAAERARADRTQEHYAVLNRWVSSALEGGKPQERNPAAVSEACRLLKQCRRPELATVVEEEMHGRSAALDRWKIAAARLADEQAASAAQEREKLELVKALILAQQGRTTAALTAEVLTARYGLASMECPDCGSPISLAGEFGCWCDALAAGPLTTTPSEPEEGGQADG